MGRTYKPVTAAQMAAYRIRCCYSLHGCNLCQQDITLGQTYHDGGYGKRSHTECVEMAIAKDRLPEDLESMLDRYVGNPAARLEIHARIVELLRSAP